MGAYAFEGELFCAECAAATMRDLKGHVPKSCRDDSECWPQGPYADGGGEADLPQHCGGCDQFLENPLTADGVAYVRRALARHAAGLGGAADVLAQWSSYYGITLPDDDADGFIEVDAGRP